MVVIAVGVIFVIDVRADHPLHFPSRHLAVERICDDQMYVVNAIRTAHIQHNLKHRLPQIRRLHRRQGQRNVVHRDRHPHSRLKQSIKRLHLDRMINRITDSGLAVRQTLDRRIRINNPRPNRQVINNKILTKRHDPRRGIFVDVNDRFVCFSS